MKAPTIIAMAVILFYGCKKEELRKPSQYLGTYICNTTSVSGLHPVYDEYGNAIDYREDTAALNYNLTVAHNFSRDSILLNFDTGNTKLGFFREANDNDLHRDSIYTDLGWSRTTRIKELWFDRDTMYFFQFNSKSFSSGQAPEYSIENGKCLKI